LIFLAEEAGTKLQIAQYKVLRNNTNIPIEIIDFSILDLAGNTSLPTQLKSIDVSKNGKYFLFGGYSNFKLSFAKINSNCKLLFFERNLKKI
jgi:hypothetical protein